MLEKSEGRQLVTRSTLHALGAGVKLFDGVAGSLEELVGKV